MKAKKLSEYSLAYADSSGNVYDVPGMEPAFRTGKRSVRLSPDSLIKLPYGSLLYTLPGRYPVFYNGKNNDFNYMSISPDGDDITAASAFLSSGYLRTYLPAFFRNEEAPVLPLWAYTGLAVMDSEFVVPAIRIDDDPRSDPGIHRNRKELKRAIAAMLERYPENRLVSQLSRCSTEYNCLCSRNFFLGRYEAPVPTSVACNARCPGCLSYQEAESGTVGSQDRLTFLPTPEEIAQVMLHHISGVEHSVVSFGQGCEGEPLLRADDLSRALSMVRGKTGAGTINLNTNGSLPAAVKLLIDSGLDSIRISLNSPTEKYYERYFRGVNFTFDDVKRSLDTALESGIFVSLNLFFMPGFTDMESEVESLLKFLEKFPVNMIQTRNLNIDPDSYLDSIGFEESDPVGIIRLLEILREKRPLMKLGYYNPPLKK